MSEPCNDERAIRGRAALGRYSQESIDVGFQDLLADLMHLADREGVDWGKALAIAETTYLREVEEEVGGEVEAFLPEEEASGRAGSDPTDRTPLAPHEVEQAVQATIQSSGSPGVEGSGPPSE